MDNCDGHGSSDDKHDVYGDDDCDDGENDDVDNHVDSDNDGNGEKKAEMNKWSMEFLGQWHYSVWYWNGG